MTAKKTPDPTPPEPTNASPPAPAPAEPAEPVAPPVPPTLAQMQEIAQAAMSATESARDAAQAATDAGNAAAEKAKSFGFELPEEVIGQIASASAAAQIKALEDRGAFREGDVTPPALPNAAPTSGEAPNLPTPPAEPVPGNDGDAPRKKTIAERVLGY